MFTTLCASSTTYTASSDYTAIVSTIVGVAAVVVACISAWYARKTMIQSTKQFEIQLKENRRILKKQLSYSHKQYQIQKLAEQRHAILRNFQYLHSYYFNKNHKVEDSFVRNFDLNAIHLEIETLLFSPTMMSDEDVKFLGNTLLDSMNHQLDIDSKEESVFIAIEELAKYLRPGAIDILNSTMLQKKPFS